MLAGNNKRQICLLLALMMAGCGGGSGSSNVSSTPAPPSAGNGGAQGNTPGGSPGITTPTPGAPPATGSPAPDNPPAPPAVDASGPATVVPPTTPISSRWVSGDVLATMLTQQTRTTDSIDDPRDAYPARAAVPWSGPGPGGMPQDDASAPNILAYQTLMPQPQVPGRFNHQSSNFWRLDAGSGGVFNFSSLSVTLDLIVSLPHYRQTANEIRFDRSGPIASGTGLLSIRDTIETRTIIETLAGRQPGEQQLTLGNGGIYNVRQGVQVPYNQVLMRWRIDSATFSEMLLLKGIDDDHARLCFNTHVPGIKRLSCTIWGVPQGWTLGQRLAFKGNYIVDDRTAQPGGSGILYWQTPAY